MPSADETYVKVARRLIPFLILCYFSAYIDRSNIGIAKLEFSGDLGITEAMFGLAGGLFYLGYSLFEVPSNLLLRRVGARRTFFRIMFLWSAFTALMATVTDASHFYILRFLIGAAEAGFFPGVLYYLSHWVPSGRRARFTAWFMSAMAVSGVIGGPLSGLVLKSLGGEFGLAGWQWLFMVEGLPGMALAFLALKLLPDHPQQAKWLTSEQQALIHSDLQRDAPRAGDSAHGNWRDVLRDPRFYGLAAMSAALIAGIGGIALWMPTILRNSGVGTSALVATVTAVPYLFALIAQQWNARHSDLAQERRWHAAIPVLIGAAAWLLIPLSSGEPWLTLLLISIATAASFAATGPFWALPPTYLAGAGAAVGIALVTTCGSIAAFVSPIIVGWAADRSSALTAGPIYYGLLLVIGGALLLLTTRRSG